MDIRQLQQRRDRLNLDMFLLQPLRPKMPIRAVLFARKRDTMQILGVGGERGLKVAVNSGRVLTEIDLESRLGFAHPVLDAHAENTIKELKQKILQQFGPLSHISSGKENTLQPIMSKNGHLSPESNSLIKIWSWQLKHRFPKTGGDTGMRGWLMCFMSVCSPST